MEGERGQGAGVRQGPSDELALDFYAFTLFTSKPSKSRSPASFLDRSYHSEYFQTVNFPYIITL